MFIISDFQALRQDSGNDLLRLRQHNDVVAVQITDPIEQAPPPPGLYDVTDGERLGVLDTSSRQGQRNYREFFDARRQQLAELMSRRNIPLISLSTTDNVVLALQARFGRHRRSSAARGAAA